MSKNNKIHFEISERKILLRVFDVFFVLGSLHLISHYFKFDYFSIKEDSYYWTILLAAYITIIGTVFDMYNLQTASNKYQILKSIILTTSVTTLLYLLTPFFTPVLPSNRLQIILFYLAILMSLLIWRNLYITFLATNRFVKRVVFIGSAKKIEKLINKLSEVNPHFQVIGFVATDNKEIDTKVPQINLADLKDAVRLNYVSEIIVADETNKSINFEQYEILLQILESGIIIRQYSDVYEQITNRLPLQSDDKELFKFFPFSRSNQNKLYLFFSRFFDIVFALIGLLFLLFILPILFIFNLVWNRGPMFYAQERVGQNGIPFKIYKLRSMIVNAEKEGAVFATTNDTRITTFGRFIRKSRLDEIPQFINVLLGKMALIGPRPERPVFVDEIAKRIPLYQTRHVIKPGLTGWAQVNYSYGESIEDSLMKLRYDLYYIKHRSLFLDLNIVVKTLNTVLFFKGQ
ncbi:sugar transferase [Flavobacterium sp.]|jgi:exopolysaccharide biosynthesis polyprenyl glycosylphosphotransferase|uniref:sugar transferase n=1 Tax=Flavobacterium sp. TaxID=239 RepID=UPI002A807648|nr:sugar transferase [Flavobacterium sp.]